MEHRIHEDKMIVLPPEDIIAVSISSEKYFDREAFYQTLEELKGNMLRLKGNINFGDGVRFVELAGTEITEVEPSEELTKQNNVKTVFTAIAWKIDKDMLRESLMGCEIS
jgi:G3E family GTPase